MSRQKGGIVTRTQLPARAQDGSSVAAAIIEPALDATALVAAGLAAHIANLLNPHATTAAQVGAPTLAAFATDVANLAAHIANVANPHAVTKAQVGLGAVPNTDFTTHETRHRSGGADPLSVLNLAGFPGGTANFLRADGSFAAPTGTGDVVGPAGATADAVALFDGVTGKLVKDSVTLLTALALLAGRAGGQTLKGGTAAAESLTLQGTAHATPGKVIIAASQLAGTAQYKALAYRTTVQSLVTATSTALGFDAEDYDVGGLHDNAVNNSRLTAPVAGYYLCFGAATFEPNGTGARASIIAKNGSAVGTQCTSAAMATIQNCPFVSKVVHLNAGDYVEMWAYQDTGGSINAGHATLRNAQPEFGMLLTWAD